MKSFWGPRLAAAIAIVCAALPVCAQTGFVTVSGSNLRYSNGPVATGMIIFAPTLPNGTPASYQLPGGGQAMSTPVSAQVSSGAFSIQLPAVDLTSPVGICFSAYMRGAIGLGQGYTCLQPHSTPSGSGDWCQYTSGSSGPVTCNLDKYVPSIPSIPFVGLDSHCPTDGNGHLTCVSVTAGSFNGMATGNVQHWRAKLQGVIDNQGYARLCLVGDSTLFGYNNFNGVSLFTNGLVSQLATVLNAQFGISTYWDSFFGTGAKSSISYGGTFDPRIVVGSSWAANFTNHVPGGGSYEATTSTNALAFTPATPVNTFKIFYLTNTSAGSLSAKIDGGTATIQSTSGSQGIGVLTLTAGSVGTHTVSVYWSSGGAVDVWGVEASDSTRNGLLIESMGDGGALASDLANQAQTYSPGNSLPYSTVGCDGSILEGGINDWQGNVSQSSFSASMQTVISSLKASGSDVMIETPSSQNVASHEYPYVASLRTLANVNVNNGLTQTPLPVIDVWQMMWGPIQNTTNAETSNGWLSGDGIHPNQFGYAAMANLEARCLVSSPCQGNAPNPFAYWTNLTPSSINIQESAQNIAAPYYFQITDAATSNPIVGLGADCTAGDCGALRLYSSGALDAYLSAYNGGFINPAAGGGLAIGSTTAPAQGITVMQTAPNQNGYAVLNSAHTIALLNAYCAGGDCGQLSLMASGLTYVNFGAYQGGYINPASGGGGLGVMTTTIPAWGISVDMSTTNGRSPFTATANGHTQIDTQAHGICSNNDCGVITLYAFGSQTAQFSGYSGSLSYLPSALKLPGVESTGTQSLGGTCARASAVGGAMAGSFTTTSTTSCTLIVTSGITANNGHACQAQDITGSAVFHQSGSSTTTCTLTGTPSASGDTIVWSATAF